MFVTPASTLPVTLRRVGWVTLACASLVLSACGGGDRAANYKPASIVSFGDENSALGSVSVSGGDVVGTVKGLTYAVNSLVNAIPTFCTDQTANTLCAASLADVKSFTAAGTPAYGYFSSVNTGNVVNVVTRIDLGQGDYAAVTGAALKRTTDQIYNCAATTIWTQYVARAFGKGYAADCPLDRSGAVSFAADKAKVADLASQIAAAKSAGQLNEGALVTVWLGQNDLVEIFDNAGITDKAAAATQRAITLIDGVKQILATGAKVVLVNAPNLAYSPYALALKSEACAGVSARPCNPDMDALVVAFNKQLITSLGTEYALNGRKLGYVDAAQLTNSYARSTSHENKRQCDAAKMTRPDGTLDNTSLLYCNSATLVSDSNIGAYLWTDDRHLSITLHNLIAQTALTRASEQF